MSGNLPSWSIIELNTQTILFLDSTVTVKIHHCVFVIESSDYIQHCDLLRITEYTIYNIHTLLLIRI